MHDNYKTFNIYPEVFNIELPTPTDTVSTNTEGFKNREAHRNVLFDIKFVYLQCSNPLEIYLY